MFNGARNFGKFISTPTYSKESQPTSHHFSNIYLQDYLSSKILVIDNKHCQRHNGPEFFKPISKSRSNFNLVLIGKVQEIRKTAKQQHNKSISTEYLKDKLPMKLSAANHAHDLANFLELEQNSNSKS